MMKSSNAEENDLLELFMVSTITYDDTIDIDDIDEYDYLLMLYRGIN